MAKERDKNDRPNLPACIVEFLQQLLKRMRYRRKVREDVQAELSAHFEDELKDCQSEQEKQQKAQKLITDFGDVKMLAILLRRAKKRCRPLWRTVVARTFQAIGIFILCFIVYVAWFFSGKPVIRTNYIAELNRIVRPAADESLNAAPLYLKAVELHKELSDDFLLFFAKNHQAIIDKRFPYRVEDITEEINELFSDRNTVNFQEKRQDVQDQVSKIYQRLLGEYYNELTVEQKDIILRWVSEHNDVLELVIEGSRKPHCWRTYQSGAENPDEMIGILMPDLSEFKGFARALRFRALFNAEQGRYEKAFDDLKACYRLGQHLRGDRTLIEQLVGLAIEAMSIQAVQDIVSSYEIDSAILAEVQRSIEQIVAEEDFIISFKVEKLCMYDEIQRCFTSDRFGKGHLYLPRFTKIRAGDAGYRGEPEDIIIEAFFSARFLLGHPNKEETLNTFNKVCDFYENLKQKSAFKLHIEFSRTNRRFEEIIKGNYFLEMFTPALWKVLEINQRHPTSINGTLTLIAVLRYKADKGQYPQSLSQLVVAGYLKELPVDTFSDKLLVYKQTGDDFVLYSFGTNCVDDGGKPGRDNKGNVKMWKDEGDAVFWPVLESQ
jgi:hypothetical protein